VEDEMNTAEHVALVALLQTRPGDAKWPELTAQVFEAGSAIAVWEAYAEATLMPHPSDIAALEAAEKDVAGWAESGLRFLTILDPSYPTRLRGIHQAPPFLFVEGTVLADDRAVSVVGSRAASARGLAAATAIATALVEGGLAVIAGLAAGIDTAAHRAALAAAGRTVAVIGTGIRKFYPAENRELQKEIAKRGLLISQFWPDAPPQRYNFPMRNATMSGYGIATVVVEAGENSGARIQARLAVEHGRPVILTDMVVDSTKWGRALIGRPAVYKASSADEVLAIVRDLMQERGPVDDDLMRLAGV
jgi:DNA processing protein